MVESKTKKEWKPPKKTDSDYRDWIEYVKLRHTRRLQNLQIKLGVLIALLATGVLLLHSNTEAIALCLFGFILLCVLLYMQERFALDKLEKNVYSNAQHIPIYYSIIDWGIMVGATAYFCILMYIFLVLFNIH